MLADNSKKLSVGVDKNKSVRNFTFCSSLVGSVDRAYSYSKLSKYYIMEFPLCHELKVVPWSYIQSAGRIYTV